MASKATNSHNRLGPHSQAQSFKSLDGRGIVARRMKAIAADLADGLGGWGTLSPQQRIIIDIVAVRMVRCQMLTAAMLGGDDLCTEAERRLNWHLASIRRDLAVLGLEKRGPRQPTLAETFGQRPAA